MDDRCESTMEGIRCIRESGHPATSTNVYRDPRPTHRAWGHRWTDHGADEGEISTSLRSETGDKP